MATITAESVMNKARKILNDAGSVRWDNADLLGWLNSGQKEIVLYKPNANTETAVITMVEGSVQTVTGLQFIRIISNVASNGTTATSVPSPVEQSVLDGLYPNWMAATPNATPKYYCFDRKLLKTFFVYPPQPASPGKVRILQSAAPAVILIGNISSATILDDIYETPLIDYIVYRAFSEDTEVIDAAKSDAFFQKFVAAMGGKAQAETIGEMNAN